VLSPPQVLLHFGHVVMLEGPVLPIGERDFRGELRWLCSLPPPDAQNPVRRVVTARSPAALPIPVTHL
jgi:hypothetical protein